MQRDKMSLQRRARHTDFFPFRVVSSREWMSSGEETDRHTIARYHLDKLLSSPLEVLCRVKHKWAKKRTSTRASFAVCVFHLCAVFFFVHSFIQALSRQISYYFSSARLLDHRYRQCRLLTSSLSPHFFLHHCDYVHVFELHKSSSSKIFSSW